MRRFSTIRGACSALALSALLSGAALAHGSVEKEGDGALESLVRNAELAFLGQVVDVTYEIEKTGGQVGEEGAEPAALPVVYVTYAIEKTLFGEPSEEKLTLRFLGGPDGMGRFLTVSGTPRFQVEEMDVLFVRGNGAEGCPLVTCQNGRFRVLRGGVYNAFGVAVQAIVDQGVITRGQIPKEFLRFAYPTPSFDALVRQPRLRAMLEERGLSVEEARKIYNEEAPREIVVTTEISQSADAAEREASVDRQPGDPGASRETEEPLQEAPIAVEEFMERVARLGEELQRDRRVIESLRPGQVPLPSLSVDRPAPEVRKIDREDEEGSVRENDGNPVLKQ